MLENRENSMRDDILLDDGNLRLLSEDNAIPQNVTAAVHKTLNNQKLRLCAAWSLRTSACSLVQRKSSCFGVLDGFRACAVIWVLSFHTVSYFTTFLINPDTDLYRIVNHWVFAPMQSGSLGVDL